MYVCMYIYIHTDIHIYIHTYIYIPASSTRGPYTGPQSPACVRVYVESGP